jgi:molybdate transport system ATP-binding protein
MSANGNGTGGLAFDVELRGGERILRSTATMPAAGTLVLFGPSGVGKTLTLRALAGLTRPVSGTIRQRGRVLYDAASGIDVRPQERRVGYVPQHAALFPHLSVRDNVAFGVRDGRRGARVGEVLEQLGLAALGERRPASLSGGERQRVAVARALAPRPETLLLDEPFTALDRRARLELRAWFRAHVRGLVVVVVTHDAEEAVELGDHLVLLDGDRSVGEGRPADVLERMGSEP